MALNLTQGRRDQKLSVIVETLMVGQADDSVFIAADRRGCLLARLHSALRMCNEG